MKTSVGTPLPARQVLHPPPAPGSCAEAKWGRFPQSFKNMEPVHIASYTAAQNARIWMGVRRLWETLSPW